MSGMSFRQGKVMMILVGCLSQWTGAAAWHADALRPEYSPGGPGPGRLHAKKTAASRRRKSP